jgi:hypothetical protein
MILREVRKTRRVAAHRIRKDLELEKVLVKRFVAELRSPESSKVTGRQKSHLSVKPIEPSDWNGARHIRIGQSNNGVEFYGLMRVLFIYEMGRDFGCGEVPTNSITQSVTRQPLNTTRR